MIRKYIKLLGNNTEWIKFVEATFHCLSFSNKNTKVPTSRANEFTNGKIKVLSAAHCLVKDEKLGIQKGGGVFVDLLSSSKS
jgi:hypothetical protein